MGKILKEKKYRGNLRGAGAFHPLEKLEAKKVEFAPEVTQELIPKPELSKEDTPNHLSRGQRKRLAKRVQLSKKNELISNSQAKAVKIKEGTLGDLSLLTLNLPNTDSSSTKKGAKQSNGVKLAQSTKMTRKNRQRITNVEIAQFQAVLAHPAFQANPLATINDHLENSIKAATGL